MQGITVGISKSPLVENALLNWRDHMPITEKMTLEEFEAHRAKRMEAYKLLLHLGAYNAAHSRRLVHSAQNLFNFARQLKISRFTIDVLVHRLACMKVPAYLPFGESEGFVTQTLTRVAACDQLHNELCKQFSGISSLDAGAISSLSAGFEELRRNIAESIARLNSLEYGSGDESACSV
jgi:hypothetical protein